MKKNIFVLFVMFSIFGCESKMSNREMFEKYYDVNIAVMLETIDSKDIGDSTEIRRYGEYVLNSLYAIDSTCVVMDGEEFNDFIINNIDSLENYYFSINKKLDI